MSVTLISSNKATKNNTAPATLDVALTGVTAGNCIVVAAHVEGTQTISFADNKSNTYSTPVTKLHSGNGVRCSIAYALNVAAGDTTITLTLSAANYRAVYAAEFSGVKTASAELDNDTSEAAAGTQNIVGPTVSASDIGVVVAVCGTTGSVTLAPSSPFSQIQEQEDGNFSSGAFEYVVATAGDYTPGWTRVNTGVNVVAAIVLGEVVPTSKIRIAPTSFA